MWKFERSSGSAGVRCSQCAEWWYAESDPTCKCLAATKEALGHAIRAHHAFAVGEPMSDGSYPHLGICSASHWRPIGMPGSGCVCDRGKKRVLSAVKELLDFVAEKYDVKDTAGFTCPIHRKLAGLLDWQRASILKQS